MKKCLLLLVAVGLAGCRQKPAPEAKITAETGALSKAENQAPSANPAPAPAEVEPSEVGPEGRWIKLYDVGGTLFTSVDSRLYRAEGTRLVFLDLKIDQGSLKQGPLPLYHFEAVLGHYPENVWVAMEQPSNQRRGSQFFVGQLTGETLHGDHHSGNGMGGPWLEMIPWTGTSVLQFSAGPQLREGKGRSHVIAAGEIPGSCETIYIDSSRAHRGWVVANQTCSKPYKKSTEVRGPAGQHRTIALFEAVMAVHVTDQGEVWALGRVAVPGDSQGKGQLCRVDIDEGPCEDLPKGSWFSSMVSAKEGGFLLASDKGVLHRPRPGEFFPISVFDKKRAIFFEDKSAPPTVTDLQRDARGILWGVARKSATEALVFRSSR